MDAVFFEFIVDSFLFSLFLLSFYAYLRAFLVACQAKLPPRLCFLLQERRLLLFFGCPSRVSTQQQLILLPTLWDPVATHGLAGTTCKSIRVGRRGGFMTKCAGCF